MNEGLRIDKYFINSVNSTGRPLEIKEPKTDTKPGGPGYECEICGKIESGGCKYGIGNTHKNDGSVVNVCKQCWNEIHAFNLSLGYISYDDFDKWNKLADRYPKIYCRNFYARPDVRKALKLKPL